MRRIFFTFLLLYTIGLLSCRKNQVEPNIKQYDQQQIQNYIAANGITGMVRDKVGGDTTGIYYEPIASGTGDTLTYTDNVSFVYTLRSFDGKYISTDTISNHYDDFLGHVSPLGLMLGIHNDLQKRGARVRFLIPSHLGYGVNGVGSGSKTLTNARIAGNQCLDYEIYVIDNEATYDQLVIKNYMAANNLTGFTETASGLWYKINTAGTGVDPITYNSTVTLTYTAVLLNGTSFSSYNVSGGEPFNIPDVIPGFQEGLEKVTTGANLTIIMPSALGYGVTGTTGVPSNSCLRYDCVISAVSP